MVLDVLAWIPYGLTHFGAPAVCSAIMFVFGPPGTVPLFARSFGYMNIAGVIIQLCFPCSPPWYENMYGLAAANYSIKGSPAGLAAIDKLLGVDLYTSTFTASPMVFGAFPSLHAGSATIEALFMSHIFPRLRPLFVVYALWLFWATMYLSHHYAVDLVGGGLREWTLSPGGSALPLSPAEANLVHLCSRWRRLLHRQSQVSAPPPAGQDVPLGL